MSNSQMNLESSEVVGWVSWANRRGAKNNGASKSKKRILMLHPGLINGTGGSSRKIPRDVEMVKMPSLNCPLSLVNRPSPYEAPSLMKQTKEACCSSPSSIRFWFVASILAWGVLSLAGIYWGLLRAYSASTILLAASVGCIANWVKNRTLHCGITAPLFLIAGALFLLSDARLIHINPRAVWPFVILGIGLAFFLEWKYARRSS